MAFHTVPPHADSSSGTDSPNIPALSTTPLSVPEKSASSTYKHLSDHDLVMEISRRGIKTFRLPFLPAQMTLPAQLSPFQRDGLIRELKLNDYRTHPYLQWTNKDLCMFIKNRNLPFPVPRNKDNLIEVLEDADATFTFPFMNLPPELRCRIYEYAMGDPDVCPVKVPRKYMPRATPRAYQSKQFQKPVPALVLVSRLIRQESLYMFERLEKRVVGPRRNRTKSP